MASFLSRLFGEPDPEVLAQRREDEAKAKANPQRSESKTALQKIKDDMLMDLNRKTKDADYYARLEERQERSDAMVKSLMSRDRSSGRSERATTPTVAETIGESETRDLTPPPAPEPVTTGDAAQGPAEENVAETARGSRRSTILTSSQGLLTNDNKSTRKKRSLMGGLLA